MTQTQLEKQIEAMNKRLDEIKSAVGWLTVIVTACFIFTAFILISTHPNR